MKTEKTELENFRKYNISDFLVNTRKFKDYLELCKKKNLLSEKKALLENIIKTLQDKKNTQNTNIITEYSNLCAFAIIFSDFEVELFFEIEHFNPDLQKNILFQTITYCYDRQKESQEYINSKFQYWILKMKNHNYASLIELKDTISKAEMQEAIDSSKNCNNQELFDNSEDNAKILNLKILYELSVYYYFNNNYQESIKYLKFLEKNMRNYENFQKYLYFDLSSVSNFLKYLNKNVGNNNNNISKNNNDNGEYIEDTKDNDIFMLAESFSSNPDEIFLEDYNNYTNEINKVKEEIKSNNNLNNNSLEENNQIRNGGFLKYLKISEYLFHMTFENINNYKELNKFLNILINVVEEKLNNAKTKEENDYFQYIKKEISYHSILLQIIDSMINNNNLLPKDFINQLSNFIAQNTFTDNISISGLIHSSIINFELEYKSIYRYFNKFVEFLNETNSPYKKEIINQVIFIARIISVFYIILDSKGKINSLGEKEIIVNIEKELHVNIINIFLFWLEKEDNENKNDLKYPPSKNIIYILIETLKILDFLKLYKIIVLGVLEFLLEKKHNKNSLNEMINEDNNKDNINEYIKQIKPNIFKISCLSEEELKQNKKVINNENLYYSIKVNFVEAKGKDKYSLKNNEIHINYYINKLFEIVELIEKKIKEYENKNFGNMIIEEQNIKIDGNLKFTPFLKMSEKKEFLYSFYKVIESDNYEVDKISNIILIQKGINYITSSMNEILINYMKVDMLKNLNQINKIYDLFKKNLNEDVISQLIICLVRNKLFLESIALIQYSKTFNNAFEYRLIKAFYDEGKSLEDECFKYIWKITYFEYFASIFKKNNDYSNLEKIKKLIKKIGNHRFFKEHPLRKHFKIINFFNFLKYLNKIIFKT